MVLENYWRVKSFFRNEGLFGICGPFFNHIMLKLKEFLQIQTLWILDHQHIQCWVDFADLLDLKFQVSGLWTRKMTDHYYWSFFMEVFRTRLRAFCVSIVAPCIFKTENESYSVGIWILTLKLLIITLVTLKEGTCLYITYCSCSLGSLLKLTTNIIFYVRVWSIPEVILTKREIKE